MTIVVNPSLSLYFDVHGNNFLSRLGGDGEKKGTELVNKKKSRSSLVAASLFWLICSYVRAYGAASMHFV